MERVERGDGKGEMGWGGGGKAMSVVRVRQSRYLALRELVGLQVFKITDSLCSDHPLNQILLESPITTPPPPPSTPCIQIDDITTWEIIAKDQGVGSIFGTVHVKERAHRNFIHSKRKTGKQKEKKRFQKKKGGGAIQISIPSIHANLSTHSINRTGRTPTEKEF